MSSMGKLLAKIGLSAGASLTVVESAQLEGLWNALLTLAISLISVLTIEGISWLKAYLKKKRLEAEAESKKYEEADEIVETVEAVEKHNKEE